MHALPPRRTHARTRARAASHPHPKARQKSRQAGAPQQPASTTRPPPPPSALERPSSGPRRPRPRRRRGPPPTRCHRHPRRRREQQAGGTGAHPRSSRRKFGPLCTHTHVILRGSLYRCAAPRPPRTNERRPHVNAPRPSAAGAPRGGGHGGVRKGQRTPDPAQRLRHTWWHEAGENRTHTRTITPPRARARRTCRRLPTAT
jgi:hypothetical protein